MGVQWGASSWVDPIQARRIRPGEDHTDVTIGRIIGLLGYLQATGRPAEGDPPPLMMLEAGNYATDISHALAAHPVQVLVRLRATRVFYADPEPLMALVSRAIASSEQHRFDHQEVAGDDRLGMCGQELPPGRPGPAESRRADQCSSDPVRVGRVPPGLCRARLDRRARGDMPGHQSLRSAPGCGLSLGPATRDSVKP
ncbi:hypothetical protein [Nonomuraea gerenzanensis]|nr:hypothetical protein [Nonomuraea gerenzanensis]